MHEHLHNHELQEHLPILLVAEKLICLHFMLWKKALTNNIIISSVVYQESNADCKLQSKCATEQ